MQQIQKILIANRGEIAIRVMRTCKEMGIATVAVYSDADKYSLFVSSADEAICIGGLQATESYLDQDKIINAAKQCGANAIHPGYGFLSENPTFVKRCNKEKIIFIGPSAEAVEKMGSKSEAKKIVSAAGVPTVPGYSGDDQSLKKMTEECSKIGYPVLIKATAGGGGKGMRIVLSEKDLSSALEAAKREAKNSFGDDAVLIEKYFDSAKHIEYQIFGDQHKNYTHFFERECSVQRRYQKIIEESPSPSLTPELREQMGEMAIAVARSIDYCNAGTVEFILAPDKSFYFLEVNARLQVEHPITEEVTGLDLVRLQIEVAQGIKLKPNHKNITQQGHAIECRICAEDPENNFFPATGTVLLWDEKELPGVRYDSGVTTNSKVDIFYDSMIAKVVVKGNTRSEAIQKTKNALDNLVILGLTTNKRFLKTILAHDKFIRGEYDTNFIAKYLNDYSNENKSNSVVINELLIIATLSNWIQRNKNNSFKHLPNGWRNNFYSYQNDVFEIVGREIKVEYKYKNNNCFECIIHENTYHVELLSSTGNNIVCSINNERKSFNAVEDRNELFIHHPDAGSFRMTKVERFKEAQNEVDKNSYTAPMPGEIVKVLIKKGDKINSGSPLLVMSSMKMETTIEAHSDGVIEEVFVAEKAFVEADTLLLKCS